MKIYNIYPTNKNGVQIGSAVFQSLNKKEALAKFDKIVTYCKELCYCLVEITFYFETTKEKHKTLKIKKYNP